MNQFSGDGSRALSSWRGSDGPGWTTFWFVPCDGVVLSVVRVTAAALGLVLWSSYAADLQQWFGPQGLVSQDLVAAWRSPYAVSLFDLATTGASLWALYAVGAAVLVALLLGIGTPLVAVAAAVLWASILHRGPMLAGPADDCLSIMLWCLAIGRSGDHLSLDAVLRRRRGMPAAVPSVRNRLSLSLLQVHASLVTAASVLAQLKGDVWWDGTAAWWLVVGRESPLLVAANGLAASEYLTNVVTHAVTLFEIAFAAGVWIVAARGWLVATGLVAWPAIGWLAGDIAWGVAMAILGLAWAPPAWFARLCR